ncbi:MAG: hypothetical protein ACQERJ_09795 [Bacillota bacterium]
MLTYFKDTLEIIKRKYWLLVIPMFLTVVAYIGEFIITLKILNDTGQLEKMYRYFNKYKLSLIAPSIEELLWIVKKQFWVILIKIPSKINFISYGDIVNNYKTFFVFLVVALCLFQFIMYKLKKSLTKPYNDFFKRFKTLRNLFFVFGVVASIVYWILSQSILNYNSLVFFSLRFMELIIAIMILSLLEVIILLEVKEFFYHNYFSSEWKAKQFLTKFAPVLKLNAIVGLFLASQNYLLISTMDDKVNIIDNEFVFIILQLINIVVFILTIFAPQNVVFKNKSAVESIKASMKFIKHNFKQFSLLLVLYGLVLFILGVIARIFNAGPLTFIYILIPTLLYAVGTTFGFVIFSVFFLTNEQ